MSTLSKTLHVTVSPVVGGWMVQWPEVAEPLLFRSGGAAEVHARDVARRLAALGHETELVVRDRTDALAGRFTFRGD